jgi:hypothetical protein
MLSVLQIWVTPARRRRSRVPSRKRAWVTSTARDAGLGGCQGGDGLLQGVTGAGDIVHQHQMTSWRRWIWEVDLDLPVAVPLFGTDPVVEIGVGGDGGYPLAGLFVRADEEGVFQLAGEEVGHQGRRREAVGTFDRNGLLQARHPVEVRINGDQFLHPVRQELADDRLADGLPGAEGLVLAHVAEVGGDQGQVARSQFAGGGGGQGEFDKLVVGVIQTPAEDDPLAQACGEPHPALAIGKAVDLDLGIVKTGRAGQALGLFPVVWKAQDKGGVGGDFHAVFRSVQEWAIREF